jgi:5-methylcytosine-specific restriction protein A
MEIIKRWLSETAKYKSLPRVANEKIKLMLKPKRHKPRHQLDRAAKDKLRPNATDRGYTSEFRRLREAFVIENPLCIMCLAEGKITPTEIVHHEKPIHSHPELRLEWSNLVPTCHHHHGVIHSGDDGAVVWNKKPRT